MQNALTYGPTFRPTYG